MLVVTSFSEAVRRGFCGSRQQIAACGMSLALVTSLVMCDELGHIPESPVRRGKEQKRALTVGSEAV